MKRKSCNRRTQGGFSIIEIMIVMSVSTVIFVTAMAALAGRQARTEFEQAIYDVKTQIEQSINDVQTGYVSDTRNYSCTAGADGPVLSNVASEQGQNNGCIALGHVIQFGVSSEGAEELRFYTLVGNQKDPTGKEVASYQLARPVVVSPTAANPNVPDSSRRYFLKYGLKTRSITYGNSSTPVGAVGLVVSLANYNSDQMLSGAQHANIMPIDGTSLGGSQADGAAAINANAGSSTVNPPSGVSMCFVAGGMNRSGLITIGGGARALSVTLSIKDNNTCS